MPRKAEPKGSRPEALELQPEDEPADSGRPPWVEEAVKLFGEDLVVVVDDEQA